MGGEVSVKTEDGGWWSTVDWDLMDGMAVARLVLVIVGAKVVVVVVVCFFFYFGCCSY